MAEAGVAQASGADVAREDGEAGQVRLQAGGLESYSWDPADRQRQVIGDQGSAMRMALS